VYADIRGGSAALLTYARERAWYSHIYTISSNCLENFDKDKPV